MRRYHIVLISLVVVSLALTSCGPGQLLGLQLTATPTPTATNTMTPTTTSTPTLTSTPTPVFSIFSDAIDSYLLMFRGDLTAGAISALKDLQRALIAEDSGTICSQTESLWNAYFNAKKSLALAGAGPLESMPIDSLYDNVLKGILDAEQSGKIKCPATPTPAPTQTAAPTATPLPSPTPAPAASVTGDSINVRSGPGTIYPVVGKAAKGESLPVIARNQDGSWLEVELKDGKRGWVATKLMQSSVPTESLPIEAKIPPAPTSQPPPAATTAPKPDYTTATIIGRVMGKDGDPKVSEHIQVTVLGFEKRIETWTGPDGRFAISGVPAGEEYLMGVLIGLETSATNSMLVVVNGDSLFSLQPGATLDLGEIKVSW